MHTVVSPERTAAHAGGDRRLRVGIAGATGYTGQELIRLLARHPEVDLTVATASGASATRRLPVVDRFWDGTVTPLDVDGLARDADVVFLALPHAAAADVAPRLVSLGARVIDLSGAFRLRDERARARWYPDTRTWPDGVAYGLTELQRAAVKDATLVSNPGCYPTAALLPLVPLVRSGMFVKGADIIVDAKSGVSGAGKTPTARTHFSEVHGSMSAYGVFDHRHAAEIDEGVGLAVTFTPHLVPLDRGMLETIYVRVAPGTTEEAVGDILTSAYGREPFVRLVGPALPEIKHVAHTNFCDIGWCVDASGRAIVVSVIDNLLKGASGQAVQNMNVMIGAPETAGLL